MELEHGRLRIIEDLGVKSFGASGYRKRAVIAYCVCGSPPKEYKLSDLISGNTRSCGCAQQEELSLRNISSKGKRTKQYTYEGESGDKYYWAERLNLSSYLSFVARVNRWKSDPVSFPYPRLFTPATRVLHRDVASKLLNYREDSSGCWLWLGNKTHDGYGRIRIGNKKRRAHIVSYEGVHGPVPAGLMVCHKCGNPLCINPNHLYAGSAKDNYADMVEHGRRVLPLRGENAVRSKLTEEQVKAIRSSNKTTRELSAEYGIGKSTVQQIKARKIWKHVEESSGDLVPEQSRNISPTHEPDL